ncbi:ceramide glucosyltransferase-like isoform X1 [Amphiura filiformis]|uniref:ceramide glucosyltransferase-like isoform X1 n=1 Tax=Amphiura filiformis TaxID=82378 RepID=UPI003B21B3B0
MLAIWELGLTAQVFLGLSLFAFGLEAALVLFHFIGILYAKCVMYRKPSVNIAREELPGVSILKPMVGVDPHLQENLESYFKIDYPKYELLLCVQEEGDPCLQIVKPLMESYPQVDAHLFIGEKCMHEGGCKIGENPKMNNVMPGYKASKYDIVMISDSGIQAYPDILMDMVSRLGPKVGLVQGLPFCTDRKGFPAVLDKVYFGGAHARMYLTLCVLGVNCVSGMSNMIRKCILEEAGGLAEFGKYISEDYYMGIACFRSGYVQRLSYFPAMQNAGNPSLKSFRKRMVRWTIVRLATIPTTLVLEPLSECIPLGFFVSWAGWYVFNLDPVLFFMCHILQWFLLDYLQLMALQREPVNFSKFDYAVAWAFREIMFMFYFLEGMFSRSVAWRTGSYRVRYGGYLEEIR